MKIKLLAEVNGVAAGNVLAADDRKANALIADGKAEAVEIVPPPQPQTPEPTRRVLKKKAKAKKKVKR